MLRKAFIVLTFSLAMNTSGFAAGRSTDRSANRSLNQTSKVAFCLFVLLVVPELCAAQNIGLHDIYQAGNANDAWRYLQSFKKTANDHQKFLAEEEVRRRQDQELRKREEEWRRRTFR